MSFGKKPKDPPPVPPLPPPQPTLMASEGKEEDFWGKMLRRRGRARTEIVSPGFFVPKTKRKRLKARLG